MAKLLHTLFMFILAAFFLLSSHLCGVAALDLLQTEIACQSKYVGGTVMCFSSQVCKLILMFEPVSFRRSALFDTTFQLFFCSFKQTGLTAKSFHVSEEFKCLAWGALQQETDLNQPPSCLRLFFCGWQRVSAGGCVGETLFPTLQACDWEVDRD